MERTRLIAFLSALLGVATFSVPASSQDYLGSFLQSQQDTNIREIQQGAPVSSKAQLRPEYERRVRLYGGPVADSWLRQEAAKAGRLAAEQQKASRAP